MRFFFFNEQDIRLFHVRDETPSQSNFYIHTHTYTELYCFVAGIAEFYVEGTIYSLEPGDILLMRPGEAHHVQVDENVPYERFCIHFDASIFNTLDPERVLTQAIFQRKAGLHNRYRMGPSGIDAMKRITAQNNRISVLGNMLLLLHAISEAFSAQRELQSGQDTLETRVIRYINHNLEKDLSLQRLSDYFYVSRTQLCRMFREATGTSVGRYVTGKRLLKARELLLQGIKPTEVYAICGYGDYSTFFRAYTRLFGHSPRQEQEGSFSLTPDTMIFLGQNLGVLAEDEYLGIQY
ncbi:MAG: AraC family transcriptional regulator [Ruminococcaceae bacterium]|nr:AraC family transcriptional regulator [Oscillospiraceae bacterium]